jgi:hypothetical protein
MKNRLLLLMLLPLTGFCQQPFSINGKIDKLKKGDKVYLFYLSGGNKLSDSALVSSTSVFKFNGMIDAATAAELSLSKTRYAELNPFLKVPTKEELDRSNFYIEPGTIKISGSNSLNMAVISGTPMNEDNKKLKVMLKPALDKENSVMESMFNLIATKKLDQKGYDEIVIKSVKIAKEQTVIKLSFAEKNLQSRLSLFLLNALTDDPNSYVEAKKTFQKIKPRFKGKPIGQIYGSKICGFG